LIPVAESATASPADVYGTSGSVAMVVYAGPKLGATLGQLAADKRVRLVNITDLTGSAPAADVHFDAVASPPSGFRTALDRARAAVHGFASYTLPGNQTTRL